MFGQLLLLSSKSLRWALAIGHFSFTNLLTSRQKTAFHLKLTAGRAAAAPWSMAADQLPQPMHVPAPQKS